MAWNRRSRVAVEDTGPDVTSETVEPDGTVETGRATPVADSDVVADSSALDRTVVDEPVVDREAERAAADQAAADQAAADQAVADRAVVDRHAVVERDDVTGRHVVVDPDADVVRETDRPAVTEPVEGPVIVPPKIRARGSLMTTIGLIISVVALCTALTGLLAPEALLLGVVAVLVSLLGMRASRRQGVTGSGTAVFAALIGIATIVFAALAMTGNFTWPNSRTDQIKVWHDWLVAHWSTLNRW